MRMSFTPISLDKYVRLHLRSNPGTEREEFIGRLRAALDAFQADDRCACGARIWVIGSAEVGNGCFACITGEAWPRDDYEIEEACVDGS